MNMSTSSLILYRTFQVLGFILAIFKIFAPFIALYLLWRIARNLEKPPKLTEEVKIVRKSTSPGRGECTGRTEKIITRCASPPYRPRTVWGSGSCGLFRCGAL